MSDNGRFGQRKIFDETTMMQLPHRVVQSIQRVWPELDRLKQPSIEEDAMIVMDGRDYVEVRVAKQVKKELMMNDMTHFIFQYFSISNLVIFPVFTGVILNKINYQNRRFQKIIFTGLVKIDLLFFHHISFYHKYKGKYHG